MMKSKILEVRDEGTRIDVLCIEMRSDDPVQAGYFRRHGYPTDGSSIMVMKLHDGRATNDPYEWPGLGGGQRTMPNAHHWILAHFNELKDGDVVDVEFILSETTSPKVAERFDTMDAWKVASRWQQG